MFHFPSLICLSHTAKHICALVCAQKAVQKKQTPLTPPKTSSIQLQMHPHIFGNHLYIPARLSTINLLFFTLILCQSPVRLLENGGISHVEANSKLSQGLQIGLNEFRGAMWENKRKFRQLGNNYWQPSLLLEIEANARPNQSYLIIWLLLNLQATCVYLLKLYDLPHRAIMELSKAHDF